MTALRWGFLGASRIGRRVLAPAVLDADGHTLVAVAARDLARAVDFAAAFGDVRAHGDYRAVIEAADVDCVYIALTNETHLPWTLAALDAGKHVLCEKPLAMDAAEVAAMLAAETRNRRRVMEAFSQFHHPQFAAARALLAADTLGTLASMHGSFTAPMPPEDFRWHACLGGGALFDLGCYCLSTMRALTGREPLRIAARQTLRGDVDETFAGLLDFGDGLLAQFTVAFDTARSQHLTLIGRDATMIFDFPYSTNDRLTSLRVGSEMTQFEPMNPYRAMVEHFGRAASGEVAMVHPLRVSLAHACAMDALFAAARDGRWVDVAADA